MSGHSKHRDRYVSFIMLCFCVFTLVHTVRPLESFACDTAPSVAIKYQKLTRHTLEEVSSSSCEIYAPAIQVFNYSEPQTRSPRPAITRFIALTWPVWFRPAHPPTPLSSSEDAH